MPGLRTALAAALLLALATGCGTENDEPATPTAPTEAPTETETGTGTGRLDWRHTGHEASEPVMVGERWTAISSETDVVFEGEERLVVPVAEGGSVDAVLLAGDTAVVSAGFGGETTSGWAVRVDLATGDRTEIVTPEPANGGAWAMTGDDLYYPTRGEGGGYCLATLALADGNGEDGWCAPARTGWTGLTATEYGVGLLTFDDARPVSCRTAHLLDGTGVPQPVDGPAPCTAWDVAATSTGVVYSEVPKAQRQEAARFYAVADGRKRSLGRGTTGSLVPCGGESFFVRDPRSDTDPARLMRWDGAELSVAYASKARGNAFLGEPACADGVLTVSAFGEGGDEQVSASVS